MSEHSVPLGQEFERRQHRRPGAVAARRRAVRRARRESSQCEHGLIGIGASGTFRPRPVEVKSGKALNDRLFSGFSEADLRASRLVLIPVE
jgi:hypothetical protein